jgi:hypothetical protein
VCVFRERTTRPGLERRLRAAQRAGVAAAAWLVSLAVGPDLEDVYQAAWLSMVRTGSEIEDVESYVGPKLGDWARNGRNPSVIAPYRRDAGPGAIWANTAWEAGFKRPRGRRAFCLWSRRSRVRVPSLTLNLLQMGSFGG